MSDRARPKITNNVAHLWPLLSLLLTLQLCALPDAGAQLSVDFGPPMGEDQELEALYRDLSSLVLYYERLDWISDEHSLLMMEGKLLEVTCQVSERKLSALKALLEEEVSSNGHVAARWRAASLKASQGGGEPPSLSDYSGDLRTERVLMSLERGISRQARCPFWLSPKRPYHGLHRDAGRFQLVLESMSSLQVVRAQDGWSLRGSQVGGSGQGRLMVASGFSAKAALAFGVELGGASTFPTNDNGERELKGLITGGAPMLLRWWLGGLRLDSELSLLARFPEGAATLKGFRVAQGIGFSTLRISGLLPHFMLWTGYESFFPPGEERISIFRIGTRVGFSWGS